MIMGPMMMIGPGMIGMGCISLFSCSLNSGWNDDDDDDWAAHMVFSFAKFLIC